MARSLYRRSNGGRRNSNCRCNALHRRACGTGAAFSRGDEDLLAGLILFAGTAFAGDAAAPRVLIHGQVMLVSPKAIGILCEPAAWSHPTMYLNVSASTKRWVQVSPGEPMAQGWTRGQSVSFLARGNGTYSYDTASDRPTMTDAHVEQLEALPAYSRVTAVAAPQSRSGRLRHVRGSPPRRGARSGDACAALGVRNDHGRAA